MRLHVPTSKDLSTSHVSKPNIFFFRPKVLLGLSRRKFPNSLVIHSRPPKTLGTGSSRACYLSGGTIAPWPCVELCDRVPRGRNSRTMRCSHTPTGTSKIQLPAGSDVRNSIHTGIFLNTSWLMVFKQPKSSIRQLSTLTKPLSYIHHFTLSGTRSPCAW